MRTAHPEWLIVLLLVVLVAACGAPDGPSVRAEEVWSRPAPAGSEMADSSSGAEGMAGTGALFMRLLNSGRRADRLLGGATDVAQVVEVHETVMENDVMTMRRLPDGLEIPAGGQVELKPGGYHIMLIGLKRDLKAGDRFQVSLQLEKSGTLTVEAEVRLP